MEELKTCTKCGAAKPLATNFIWRKDQNKYRNECNCCRLSQRKAFRDSNPERIKAQKKADYEKHKDTILAKNREYQKTWRVLKKIEIQARRKEYYEQNKEEILKKQAIHRESRKEQRRQYQKRHRALNGDKVRAGERRYATANRANRNFNTMKYQATKAQRTPPWLTQQDFDHIQTFYQAAQAISAETGIKFHVDHIVPLRGANVSGLHVPWNLQVIPGTENSSKGNRYHGP